MIEGQKILCFAPGLWDDIWRNRHQLMSRLARRNRVLYIEPRVYLRPLLRSLRRGKVPSGTLWPGPVSEKVPGLYVYHTPLVWPRTARKPFGEWTHQAFVRAVHRVMERLEMASPILWLFLPDMGDLIGEFGERLVVYHVVDDYTGYTGVSEAMRPVLREMERQVMALADVVFVTSEALLEQKRVLHPNVHLVPNGVDYAAFTAARSSVPPGITALPGPVVGYVGAINDKVDVALILRVAQAYPDWMILLVGPVGVTTKEGYAAIEALHKQPNVHFTGRVAVEDVPAYVWACDVCLLPYHVNDWTRHIDALKLYEYLACGKPVVATGIPAARKFGEVVYVAERDADFVSFIGHALNECDPTLATRRQAIAAQNTWDERIERLSAALKPLLS